MKPTELRVKSEEELRALLAELREKNRTLRFDLSQGKVKNTRALREIKKDIARILTILNERKSQK